VLDGSSSAGRNTPGRKSRPRAALGIAALVAQLALPSLHALAVRRDAPTAPTWLRDAASSRQAVAGTQRAVHDASDCPVCRSLVQVQHFLAPPTPVAAVRTPPRHHDGSTRASAESATLVSAASPRGPPRRA